MHSALNPELDDLMNETVFVLWSLIPSCLTFCVQCIHYTTSQALIKILTQARYHERKIVCFTWETGRSLLINFHLSDCMDKLIEHS